MTRRSKIWLAVAVLFSLLNLAGGVIAGVQGEVLHTAVHAGLLLAGAYLTWRLIPKRLAPTHDAPSDELTDRLTYIEQSVDAVAIEVERIGEGQRFITRRFTEDAAARAAGEGGADPMEIKRPEEAPHVRRD